MSIRTTLNDAIKHAMRQHEADTLSTLRLMSAAIKQKDIDARMVGNLNGIDDSHIVQLIHTMIKQRRESISLYEKGGRPELAAKEQTEITILNTFLPPQMGDHDIECAVKEAISELKATSPKDMGALMAFLKQKYAGQIDFSKASSIVKQHLT